MGETGIVGYGAFIPRLRITVEEIARTWKKDGAKIASGLELQEKNVGVSCAQELFKESRL